MAFDWRLCGYRGSARQEEQVGDDRGGRTRVWRDKREPEATAALHHYLKEWVEVDYADIAQP